ncbi:oligodendrocyte-myelin glycoprotein-like [Aulostomus maculatus]
MRSRHALLSLSPNEAPLEVLLVLLLVLRVLAVCPSVCTCNRSHREVDCSWRGLRQLPDGLQHNLLSLNLSHNRFHNLDGQLTSHTHLRVLDLSHNRLNHLPTGLPRSLWHLYATSNHIHLLDKNDTVYQWNLRTLDLSNNKLERAIFINNTLINLCTLNLSYNHFWTLPTNMPAHLETIDLSHNLLVQVLPGSLDRLTKLTHFYLHANRLSMLPVGALAKMTSLRLITLGDNPWACHLYADITYLLSWAQRTPARVLGCPCHTHPVCGGVRPSRTGGWHFASYNLPPLAANAQEMNSMSPEVTWSWYISSLLSTTKENTQQHPLTATPTTPPLITTHSNINHLAVSADDILHTDVISGSDSPPTTETSSFTDTSQQYTLITHRFLTTQSPSTQTKKTTTLRTRSVRRPSLPSSISNSSPTSSSFSHLHNLGLLCLILQQVP